MAPIIASLLAPPLPPARDRRTSFHIVQLSVLDRLARSTVALLVTLVQLQTPSTARSLGSQERSAGIFVFIYVFFLHSEAKIQDSSVD